MKIGIDLGGSHISIGVILNDTEIIDKYEIDIISKENIKEFVENTIVTQINKFSEKYEITNMGIAVPGIVENGIIKGLFNLGIQSDYDLVFNLNNKLKNKYLIKIANDGVCATNAEVKYGSLQRYKNSLFICLGTGIGGGICQNGKVMSTEQAIGFTLGHLQIKNAGKTCKCGKTECFEIYGSIKALKYKLIEYLKLSSDYTGKVIYDAILENIDDNGIREIIDNYIKEIVYGISLITNIAKPEIICLGGGFSYYKDILLEKFVNEFSKGEFIEKSCGIPTIVIAKFGNDAGVIGSC